MPTGCLDDATARAFATGELDEARLADVDAHLDECPACLALVHGLVGGEPAPATDVPDLVGTRFRVEALLAEGGMGRIYRAFDRELGRAVALKVPRRGDAAVRRRFDREVALTTRLEHPGVVPIHGAGVASDGTPFYAMRIIDGEPLDTRLATCADQPARLALLHHVVAICDTVAYAHAQGVVHRDLKPGNVLVGRFGETVVIDWGLAKQLDAAAAAPVASPITVKPGAATGDAARTVDGGGGDLLTPDDDGGDAAATRLGDVIGTPAFMSPEQARGLVADARTDVFALGVILHHLLTGATSSQAARVHPGRRLAPPELVAIADRATAPAREDRYADAEAMAADLRRYQAGAQVTAFRYGAVARLGRLARRHRGALLVGAAAVIALGVLGGVAVQRLRHERGRAEAQRLQAEQLADRLLDDLGSQARAFGQVSMLRSVGDAVTAYYQPQATSALADVGVARRWSAAEGTVRAAAVEVDDLDAAGAASAHELVLARRAVALRPDAPARARLGDALAGAASLARRHGDAAGAGAALRECRDVVGARDDDRTLDQWLTCTGAAILVARDAADEPTQAALLAEFDPAVAAALARAPTDERWRAHHAFGLAASARLQNGGGATGLIARYRAARDEYAALLATRFDSAWLEPLVALEHDLATEALRDGNLDEARAGCARGDAAAARLLAIDPTRGDWRLQAASMDVLRGDVDVKAREFEQAASAYERARTGLAALVAGAARDPKYALFLGLADTGLAAARWLGGDADGAVAPQQAANATFAAAFARDARVDLLQNIIVGEQRLTGILASSGDTAAATDANARGLARVEEARQRFPDPLRWNEVERSLLTQRFQLRGARGDRAGARADLERTAVLAREAVALAPDDRLPRIDLAMALIALAFDAAPADRAAAVAAARAALDRVGDAALSPENAERIKVGRDVMQKLEAAR